MPYSAVLDKLSPFAFEEFLFFFDCRRAYASIGALAMQMPQPGYMQGIFPDFTTQPSSCHHRVDLQTPRSNASSHSTTPRRATRYRQNTFSTKNGRRYLSLAVFADSPRCPVLQPLSPSVGDCGDSEGGTMHQTGYPRAYQRARTNTSIMQVLARTLKPHARSIANISHAHDCCVDFVASFGTSLSSRDSKMSKTSIDGRPVVIELQGTNGIDPEISKSPTALDNEILTRTGKRPVLKVRHHIAQAPSSYAESMAAQFWFHVHLGLQLPRPRNLGGRFYVGGIHTANDPLAWPMIDI